MVRIAAADLTRYSNSVNSSLIDSGVNSRTHVTLPCRLDVERTQLRLEGLPSETRVSRWMLTFQAGADVRVSDSIAIAGKGTFLIFEMASPVSVNTSTTTYAAMSAKADGSWPILTNYTVTLRRRDQNGSIVGTTTIPVLIYSKQDDEKVSPPSGRCYAWTVCFPLTTLLNGTKVQAEDEIVWNQLRKGWAPLHRPEQHTEIIPYANANFEEVE